MEYIVGKIYAITHTNIISLLVLNLLDAYLLGIYYGDVATNKRDLQQQNLGGL